jgi:mRNA-degrading endonuclease RelE of RelBE toxin-antitoxin system
MSAASHPRQGRCQPHPRFHRQTHRSKRLGKALKGPLGELWLYRVGNFRIVCDLQDEVLTVLALQIGNRREVNRR